MNQLPPNSTALANALQAFIVANPHVLEQCTFYIYEVSHNIYSANTFKDNIEALGGSNSTGSSPSRRRTGNSRARPPQRSTGPAGRAQSNNAPVNQGITNPMPRPAPRLSGREAVIDAVRRTDPGEILDLSHLPTIPKLWNREPKVPEIRLWFGLNDIEWANLKVAFKVIDFYHENLLIPTMCILFRLMLEVVLWSTIFNNL